MYSQFFGLHKNPFSQLVRQNNVFLPDNHQLVFNQLVVSIKESTGVVGLVGTAGVGKSTLIRHLEDVLSEDNQTFVFKDLSTFINAEDWSETPRHDFADVIEAMREDCQSIVDDSCKSIYLLDIAEAVDEVVLVELLKIVTSQNANNNPTMLILVGCGNLEHSLKMAQFSMGGNPSEKIYQLDVLNEAEVKSYIDHRLRAVCYVGSPLFTDDAINAITSISKGIPKHINTICGMTLFQADLDQLPIVTEKEVIEASEICFFETETEEQLPIDKQPFNDSFIKVPEGVTIPQSEVRESIITRTDKARAVEPVERQIQVECSESASHPTELEQSDVHDQAVASVSEPEPEPELEPEQHKDNFENLHTLQYLGVVVVLLLVLIVITDQWRLVQQTINSVEQPETLGQSDQFQPAEEVFRDHPFSIIEQESAPEIDDQYTAFSIVDLDDTEITWNPSAEFNPDHTFGEITDLLDQARMLERRHQLTLPENNNAMAKYRQILNLQPENSEAIQAIERIKQQFIQQAKWAIAQSQWKVAQSYLLKARQIDAKDKVIETLFADIEKHQSQAEVSQDTATDSHELAARERASARYKLSEQGIDFNLTDFFMYAEQGNAVLIELFLDAGMPVDAQDTYSGETVLIKALTFGHLGTATLILSRRANVDIQSRNGRTAVMSAIVFERYSIVFDILNRAVDINASDQNGWSALMFAVQKNQPTIVEALLRKGADIDAKNSFGQTALSIAQDNSHRAIISLLQPSH